jgi:hypothetical protein
VITRHWNAETGVTTHVCTGRLSADEIAAGIRAFYDEAPTPHTLWDLRDADVSGISADQIATFADLARDAAAMRGPGKTALVAAGLLAFGLSRMFEAYSDATLRPVRVRVFKNIEEAEAWISE